MYSFRSQTPSLAERFSRRFPLLGTLFALFASLLPGIIWAVPSVSITDPADAAVTVNQGHLVLRWEASDPEQPEAVWEYQAVQAYDADFAHPRQLYTGPDTGTFISGLPSGGAYIRVRARAGSDAQWSEWSETLAVEVAYPARSQVVLLGSLGLLMLLILVGAITRGARLASAKS